MGNSAAPIGQISQIDIKASQLILQRKPVAHLGLVERIFAVFFTIVLGNEIMGHTALDATAHHHVERAATRQAIGQRLQITEHDFVPMVSVLSLIVQQPIGFYGNSLLLITVDKLVDRFGREFFHHVVDQRVNRGKPHIRLKSISSRSLLSIGCYLILFFSST